MDTFRLAVLIASLGLCVPQARSAAPPSATVPILRHENYLALRADRGTVLQCQVASVRLGGRVYRDPLKIRLLSPDGYTAASARVLPTEVAKLAAKVEWDGVCALESLSGSTLVRAEIPDGVPHAYWSRAGHPMKTVGAWGPFFFQVPAKTSEFTISFGASVTREGLAYTVKDSKGNVVATGEGDFDQQTDVAVAVSDGQDGTTWSLEISRPSAKGIYLDDVSVELGPQLPPFLAPRPEWAPLFARDWRTESKRPTVRRRPADTPPTVEPFHRPATAEIEGAYSRDIENGWKTTLPFTYILDYGRDHVDNDDYIPTVATAPPTLLHLGKDVPFNHGWGPIKALGGENQAYGTGESIDRISPDEVKERIAKLSRMVDHLHASGVRWVTPYICAMTLNGDAERRSGFWDFYDHWDSYCKLGLAMRPESDPIEWLQRSSDGRPYQYYKYAYPDQYYPAFKTNHRYAACWRSDGWRTWLCEVTRFVAKTGCDGVFVDNGRSQRCQCPRCLRALQEYLKEHYSQENARKYFGVDSFADIAFPVAENTLLQAELNRFWCTTVRDQLAALKKVGTEELGREFIVFPNGGDPKAIQRAMPDADFVMFEKSYGDYGTHPGLVISPLFQGVQLRAYNNNVFEYKFVQCLRQRVKPIILSRAGYPRQPPERFLNADAARLGMAECGAFSGGGAFLVRPYFGIYHDALNEYRRFFETHRRLYAGLDTCAPVAVLALPEQQWLGNPSHMGTVGLLTDLLTSEHILFDFVSEFRLQEVDLNRYQSVVVADLRVVSDEQLTVLETFVRQGGQLFVAGDLAMQDEFLGARGANETPFLALVNRPNDNSRSYGRGHITRVARIEDIAASLGRAASVLHCPDARLGAQVKVNAFQEPGDTPRRLIVHLVNYNVPLGVDPDPPVPVEGLELTIPVPEDCQGVSARACSPERVQGEELAVRHDSQRATIAVPSLRIYEVVEVLLR